jgi:hypothetical protein
MTENQDHLNQQDPSEEEHAFFSLSEAQQEHMLDALDAQLRAMSDEQLWEIGYQRCTACQQVKRLDTEHYAPASRYAHKFRRRCRVCDNEKAKQWNREHTERANTNRNNWVAANRDANREYQRDRYHDMAKALRYVREHRIPLEHDNQNKS